MAHRTCDLSPTGDTGESILASRLRRDEVAATSEAVASGLCGLVDCSGLPAAKPGGASHTLTADLITGVGTQATE